MLAQVLEQAVRHVQDILPNMLAVLGAAFGSTLAVSFFRGETTVFKNLYLVIVFVTGTLDPTLGVAGGGVSALLAHRRSEWDQRESALLFTLLLMGIAGRFGLLRSADDIRVMLGL